jgi:hypothetical protein
MGNSLLGNPFTGEWENSINSFTTGLNVRSHLPSMCFNKAWINHTVCIRHFNNSLSYHAIHANHNLERAWLTIYIHYASDSYGTHMLLICKYTCMWFATSCNDYITWYIRHWKPYLNYTCTMWFQFSGTYPCINLASLGC